MNEKVPLYYSIMEAIKDDIINGIYPLGSLLPTENEFEDKFKVSKITIRKAIELLENDGYVAKKSGKGTTVISNSIFNKLSNSQSFSSLLNKQGHQITKENTHCKYIENVPQDELFQYFGKKCLKITRCYYLDGEPYIHFTHFLPGSVDLPTEDDYHNFSLYMYLYKSNHTIADFNDDFFVEFPPLEILNELQLDKGPVLGRKRISHDAYGNIVEISFARYNTRIHNYQIKYKL